MKKGKGKDIIIDIGFSGGETIGQKIKSLTERRSKEERKRGTKKGNG